MPEDTIPYDDLVLEALRGVVRSVLLRVLKRGMPGDHHFYITFDTRSAGVGLSKRLKDQYPTEMTIVLQHQFWDLAVTEDRFEVRLSFNNIPERLVIPFSAVRIFQDPSVHFALGLRASDGEMGKSDEGLTVVPSSLAEQEVLALPHHDNSQPEVATEALGENDEAETERKTAEVVSLDKFRKK
ncbi:hypothetical protein KKP04_05090 [Rhodomicrobium sp. Az07]|uniref:SspB family protein n=1 Tax=Rhodomicrobium sp. Az07 TaxID=2839034 RepID=UPI001BE79229|nr:ClpXP protease specificity-enhancing factor SspB [Rhodomicrobium sp. Az07]MBT3070241.1 hypothetical protein [Rhodomicrobium sp. Az07]